LVDDRLDRGGRALEGGVSVAEAIRVSPGWLDLRERADAAARSLDLVGQLRGRLRAESRLIVHDLACGSGSMGRWLAPLLAGPQHWILHDHDHDLLARAQSDVPGPAADGAAVTVEIRPSDVTRLGRNELAGADLVTASALLDLLTGNELAALIWACAGAGCPLLFALSVTGRVRLLPSDPLDSRVAAAFDAHQRRLTSRGRLCGPDAVGAAAEAFGRLGAETVVEPSPWRLGADDARLATEWFAGWIGAACEEDPVLASNAGRYRAERLRDAQAGGLAVTVDHADLLVLP
jgi:hypothetical protein